jgi:hypothetical protein
MGLPCVPIFVHCLKTLVSASHLLDSNYVVLSDVVCALDALECKSSDKLFGVRKLLRNGDVKFSRVAFQNQVPNAQKMHYSPLQRPNDLTTCGGK